MKLNFPNILPSIHLNPPPPPPKIKNIIAGFSCCCVHIAG